MPVRFVVGRAGSGKTHRCFSAIVDALARDPLGPAIYWIVPKQGTFQAERELACSPQLNGFCSARVVSFELLGEEILADCGGGAIPQVTSAGRQMVLGHLLRTHADQLTFFNSVARQSGLAAELDATFAEFERSGKDVADFKMLLADLESNPTDDPQAGSLLAKFHDLHLLYDAYTRYLGQDRLDPHRRLKQVLDCIENCKLIQGAHIYVDGFHEFTDFERRTLAGIAKVCAQMEITLLLDPSSAVIGDAHKIPDELSLFHRTEQTYRRLFFTFTEDKIDLAAPVLLGDAKRFTNAYLAHVEKGLMSARATPAHQSTGIELIAAPDRRAEVDAAARKIRQWMLAGVRLREIAVLARSLDSYAELIDASFNEHGISYFVDRRRPAAHHPLPQVVRAILLLGLHAWPHDAMMTLMKSGLCGLTLAQADEVENYAIMHRVRGSEWGSTQPWKYRRGKLTRGEDQGDLLPHEQFELERIDMLRRRVTDPVRAFVTALAGAEALPIRQYIRDLFGVLEAFNVRSTLLEWIKASGDLEQRGEHQQVWSEFIALLDQMADVMGDEPVKPADFLAIMESGLEAFDLALTPQTVDQVLVGAVDRTRTPVLRATILLGANEGEFPRAPRDETILSDGERRALASRKMDVDPDTRRLLLDEMFLGYIAFTRASERMLITRTIADDARRPMMPSTFWKKLRSTLPDALLEEITRGDERIENIGTPRQLVTRLMKWTRQEVPELTTHNTQFTKNNSEIQNPKSEIRNNESKIQNPKSKKIQNADPHPPLSRSTERGQGDALPALYQWLATHECSNDAIDVMRYRAWRALGYDNQAVLSPAVGAKLFASPLHASVSRIESFATCPFQHFARYGLGLNEREDAEVSALDLGNVYHGILENLVRDMVQKHKSWGADPKNITDAAIAQFAKQVGETLKGELMLSSARNQYLLSHVQRTLGQVIDSQSAAAARGGFKPLRAELAFGFDNDQSLPPLEMDTPRGNRLRLRGKIDRVDILEEQAAIAVIDYKLSGNSLSLDRVYHGLALQLLTYLLVLQANGEHLAGKKLTPAAAFYVKLLRKYGSVKHPSEAPSPDDESFHLSIKPRGIIHRDFLNQIDDQLTPNSSSSVVQARLNKDGQLGNRKNSDAAEANEFATLLNHVQKRLGELGDQIIAGRIDVSPYRMGQITPCAHCDYRAVCRFDTLTNRYHHLTVLGRKGVLDQLAQEAADGE